VDSLGVLEGELAVESVLSVEQTNYPMTIVASANERELSIKAVYDPGYFSAVVTKQMVAHFSQTLRSMAGESDERVGNLPVCLSRTTAKEVISPVQQPEWEEPLHRIFETQVARAPDAIAAVDGYRAISYDALNRRANQLAHHLASISVGPGTYVAVCLERSVEMIVAILATLKAGAAYVPIDCRFPAKRIETMAAHARFAIVDGAHRDAFLSTDIRVVEVEQAARVVAGQSERDLTEVLTTPEDVAYLMYTSGSSGEPKGTLVTHHNASRLFGSAFQLYSSLKGGVWSFFHSIAFDFSVWEIFGALLTGGRLVVTPYWTTRSLDRFAELIRREGINVLSQTPSAFQELLSVGGLISSSDPFDLEWVVFGGEALHLTPLLNYCGELDRRGVRLLNMYGITETTVHVTHRLMDDYQQLEGRSCIGKALPDLRIYLVDQYLTPVPDQVAGEICVAGEGVTLGYIGRPRLTAERFVPSPFSGDVGGRLYRSGDLGRNAGHSDMEYLGRGDRQVKIRGFRVELDEIRLHILRQPAVRDALVRVEENRTGNRALVAYIVPASSEFSIASLRAGLREHVPDYMIPAFIRVLARFPLTPNGKVDYAALSSNAGTDERSCQGFVPPHTWEQESIADVWRDVLGVQEVGIYDSFFALGGDSIKALRAVAQLRSLGFEASIEALFEHPTVAELSRLVSSSTRPPENMSVRDDGDASELQTTERLPDGVIDTYPTTQLQLAMFFHGADSGEEAPLYHNVSLVRVGGVFDETRFRQIVDNLVAKHPSLRTAFALEGFDIPIQMVYASVKVPVTIARLEGLLPSDQRIQIESWFEREKRRGFALDIAPLIRFHIAVCSDRLFYLGVTEHHAILDGWSVASLLTELFEGYVGHSLDHPQSRPYCPEANACRQYALLERKAIASNAHQTFWKEYLDGYSPLQLPVRLSDGGAEFGRSQVKKERVTLDDALTSRLRSLARESQVPLKTVLLAAHLNVLGFIANSPDTITGLITHGRPEMDGGEAAGLFLNTLPLRIKQTATTWNQWIRRVFDEERRLLPFRRYPLQAMRDQFDRPPSLNTAFNYTNFHVYERLQAAAAIQILDIQVHESTNFDLLVDFTVMSRTGKLDLTLSYNTTSFGFGQIDGVIRSYVECLEAMTALEPTTANTALARHTSEQDIEPISVSSPLSPRWTCIQELIATASEPAWSDRIALVDGHRHVSYGELWTQVRGLELQLRTSGLATESTVAVLMDKSVESVTVMLTVMVAGWAFVPLDGTDPAERIHYIVKDTSASIVITDTCNAPALPESGPPVILLDRLAASQSWRNGASGLPTVSPDNLVYILYTSGTTGRPKGVAMHHGGIANLMKWQCHAMPVENQRVLHYAPIGFDVSVQEVLTALCGQSTLVVVPAGMRRDFVNLAHLACEQQIECIFAPDTVIRALLLASEGCRIELPALRMIVNAGEPLTIERELVEFMRSGGTVYNHYGPTESHVVTAAQIEDSAAMEDPRAPIGRAIDRTRILILDWCSRPVLPGTVGEIYIEGPNVARGYHRAPGLTAERFVPNPLPGPQPGARVFRTGDLGYRNNRGTIWFRGRADAQVKVRGYRIELEEIRHALLRHPGVADAAVTTTGDRDEKSLCAYIVPQHNVDTDNVREFARTLLPVYMVPSLVQTVSSIPTTRNGKVDYAALAAMASPVRTPVSVSKPIGAIQTELLAMWRDIVKNNVEIGPDVDFLQIGGNSILLLQLQLKLRARFGVNVSMGRLALNSSFSGMCCCIREALDKQGSTGADAKRGKTQPEALSILTKVATPMSD